MIAPDNPLELDRLIHVFKAGQGLNLDQDESPQIPVRSLAFVTDRTPLYAGDEAMEFGGPQEPGRESARSVVSMGCEWALPAMIQTGTIATLAPGFGLYLSHVVGRSPAQQRTPEASAIVTLTGVNLLGVRTAKCFQNVSTAIKIAGLTCASPFFPIRRSDAFFPDGLPVLCDGHGCRRHHAFHDPLSNESAGMIEVILGTAATSRSMAFLRNRACRISRHFLRRSSARRHRS